MALSGRCTALALVALLAACSASLADDGAPPPSGATTPEVAPSCCPVIAQADAMLAQATSASEAAVEWFRASWAANAPGLAERYWGRMVDEARQQHESRMGCFVYTPDSSEEEHTGGDPWRPVGEAMAPGTERVVLLVHGLDEPGDIWDDLTLALHGAGHTVVRFDYPNDQDPALSADALATCVRVLGEELGVKEIDLVGHSMGGLIGRDLLTRPEFYNADASARDGLPAIPRFITIGTPNQGSVFAPLRALGEVREHFGRWIQSDARDLRAALEFLSDGDGAAADALTPGSAYLKALNARPLPANTRITVIIGRASPVEASALDPMLDSEFALRVLGAGRIERLRQQASEVVGAVGDGVVTVESARLEGVEDTVILDANHRSLVRRIPLLDRAGLIFGREPGDPPGIAVVLDRLGAPGAE